MRALILFLYFVFIRFSILYKQTVFYVYICASYFLDDIVI